MSKLLVIFDGDWADEMDIQGFMIVSDEAWKYKQLEWKNTKFPQELGIGTNETMIYDDLDEYVRDFKTKLITDEEEQILRKLFNMNSTYADFGLIPWIEGNADGSFYDEHGYCPD
jgi:hypothetical protein